MQPVIIPLAMIGWANEVVSYKTRTLLGGGRTVTYIIRGRYLTDVIRGGDNVGKWRFSSRRNNITTAYLFYELRLIWGLSATFCGFPHELGATAAVGPSIIPSDRGFPGSLAPSSEYTELL